MTTDLEAAEQVLATEMRVTDPAFDASVAEAVLMRRWRWAEEAEARVAA